MTAVLGTAFVDGLFMLVAIYGVAAMKFKRIKMSLNIFGAIVLCLFGISFVKNTLDANEYFRLDNMIHSSMNSAFYRSWS